MGNTRDTGYLQNLLTYDASGNIVLPANLTVNGNLLVATQSYVTTQINNLINGAPALLDTLDELAAALGDDANFASTITTSIAGKQAQLNGTGFVKVTGTTVSYDNSTYLTTSSASSTYVSYTGATQDVNLGVYSIATNSVLANQITVNPSGSTGAQVFLKHGSSFSLLNGFGSIGSSTGNQFRLYQVSSEGVWKGANISLNSITSSATRTYTLPDASGTLALTSDIPSVAGSYLPLTGGTLTGTLSVTNDGQILIGTTNAPTPVVGVSFPFSVTSAAATRIRIDSTRGEPNYANAGVGLYANGVQKWSFAHYSTNSGVDYDFTIYNDALLSSALLVKGSNNNIGIGTVLPKTRLDIFANSDIWHTFIGGSTSKLLIGGQTGAGGVVLQAGNSSTENNQVPTTAYPLILQRDGGNVGIGTPSPSTALEVVGAGAANTYRGVIRIGNTSSEQWGGLAFPDSVDGTDSSSNNYYFIGRGEAIADRTMSFHIPTAGNYGSGSQPYFRFSSTGSDNLMTIEASTGNTFIKGYLGLNTTSPKLRLDVQDSVIIGNYTNTYNVYMYDGYVDGSSSYYQIPRMSIGLDSSATGAVDQAPVALLLHNNHGADGSWVKLSMGGKETTGGGNTVSWAGIAAKKTSGVNGSWAAGDLYLWTKSGSGPVVNMVLKSNGTTEVPGNIVNTSAYKANTFIQLTSVATKTFSVSTQTQGNFAVTDFSGVPSNAKALLVYGWYHITGYSVGSGQGDHAVSWFGLTNEISPYSWSSPGSPWPGSNSSFSAAYYGSFAMEHDGDASVGSSDLHYFGSWHNGIINVNANGTVYYTLGLGISGGTHHIALYCVGYWV